MIKFLIDTQLPGTLAQWLRGRDIDAIHVLECGLGQSDDLIIWNRALEEDRIIISKDEDFFIFVSRPNDKGRLLWIRLGNCRTSDMLSVLNQRWDEIASAFEQGQRIVEIR